MKKNILMGVGCVVLLLLSASAYGARGPYISGNLGFAMLGDTDVTLPDVDEYLLQSQYVFEFMGGSFEGSYGYNVESKMGIALTAAMGYDFGNNFRAEAEIVYQKNDVDKANYRQYQHIEMGGGMFLPPGTDIDRSGDDTVSGDTSILGFMMNGYYDFANSSAFTPFVSSGIGFAKVEYNYSSEFLSHLLAYMDAEGNPVSALDDSGDDTVIAYQLGAGVGYAVTERLTLDFKYRYFATEGPEFRDAFIDYTSHNFYIGARFGF